MIEMLLGVLLIILLSLILFLIVGGLYCKISIYLLYWRDFPTIKLAWEAYKREGKEMRKNE